MGTLELTRSPGDRRLYTLDGVGSLRLEGFMSRRATARTDAAASWNMRRTGILGRRIEAVAADGALAGEFNPRSIRRGGELRWAGAVYELRPAAKLRERYALVAGGEELAVIESKGWGKRPVKVDVLAERVERGLLLFAVFVVRALAEDTAVAGSSAATSAATAG